MKTVSVDEAGANFHRIVAEVTGSHKPIRITGKRRNAILVSEEDWRSIQEMLHLLSIPGMGDSIRRGLETPIEECSEELQWRSGEQGDSDGDSL